jgi:hypothetical protein
MPRHVSPWQGAGLGSYLPNAAAVSLFRPYVHSPFPTFELPGRWPFVAGESRRLGKDNRCVY